MQLVQVDLASIIVKYREELAEKTHQAICYKILATSLEEENKRLRAELEALRVKDQVIPGDPPDPDTLPRDE